MRKIITTTFITLDGVMQAPGGPEEDKTDGFAYGGWSANYWDKMMGDVIVGFMNLPFELLLGRKTYDIFAAFWPNTEKDLEAKTPFNKTKKYVVSREDFAPTWNNSEVISRDITERLKELKKEDGPDLWVHGSGELIQTLLAHDLIDQMHVWTFPVTVGAKGKRLFADGTKARGFKLIDSKVSTTGVIIATYESEGELVVGSMA